MPTPAGGLRNLNVVHLRRSHDRSHFLFPAVAARGLGAGAARVRHRAERLRQHGRQHDLGFRRSSQIRSVRVQATGDRAQDACHAGGGTAGPDGEGRNRRRRFCDLGARLSQRLHRGPRANQIGRRSLAA